MSALVPSRFTVADLRARSGRLHPLDAVEMTPRHQAGDHITDPSLAGHMEGVTLRDAAVLVPIVARPGGASLLLTLRTDHLASHAGQIAFPGGKIDPDDAGPVAAALRESHEEIGLERHRVEPLGLLHPYVAGSGYRIFPVVGLVAPESDFRLNPAEVAEVFEVPLAFLMSPDNHLLETRLWRGIDRRYYAMPYEGRRIWGITAGIIRLLHDQVFA